MKGIIVRVCAWFTLAIFSLMTFGAFIMLFTEPFSAGILITLILCLLASSVGWSALKFQLPGYKIYPFSKPVAMISVIFGIVFIILVPFLFASSFGLKDSWVAIINLLLIFSPVVISATAILISKTKKVTESA